MSVRSTCGWTLGSRRVLGLALSVAVLSGLTLSACSLARDRQAGDGRKAITGATPTSRSRGGRQLRAGGKSHLGEALYLLVFAAGASEKEVAVKQQRVERTFAELQLYLVVDKADHYRPMAGDGWIVFEAYSSARDARNALASASEWLGGQGLERPRLLRTKVECLDRFPLVEDMQPVGDSGPSE